MSTPKNRKWLWTGMLTAAIVLGACCRLRVDAFTVRVANRIREALPDAQVFTTTDRLLEIWYADRTIETLSLEDLWRQCNDRPES